MTPAEVREAVVAALRHSAPALAARVGALLIEHFPEYRTVAGLAEAAETLVAMFLDALEADRGLSPAETAMAMDLGEQRARQGLALDTLLGALFTAVSEGEGWLLREHAPFASSDPGHLVLASMLVTMRRIEGELRSAFAAGARRAQRDHHDQERRAREAFLRRLLTDPGIDLRAAQASAAGFGVVLRAPMLAVALVERPGHLPAAPALVGATIGERLAACVDVLDLPDAEILVFDDSEAGPFPFGFCFAPLDRAARSSHVEALGECARIAAVAALHHRVPAVSDLGPSFRRLRLSLSVLRIRAETAGAVLTLDDLLPLRLCRGLSDEEHEGIIRAAFGPLRVRRDERGTEGMHVLRSLVECGNNLTAAARRIPLSPSQVSRRKAEIEALTGRRIEENLLYYEIAFALFDLWEDRLPPAGDPWWNYGEPVADDTD